MKKGMVMKHIKSIVLLSLAILLMVAVSAFAGYKSVVKKHPMQFTTLPLCSNCHTDERAVFDHGNGFSSRHGYYAFQKESVCAGCHAESFCADCHANKEEIKPVDKFKDSPERMMPHRGDYISRHKIDGKINPAPCMKCHGRKNNERCKTCHR